MSRMVQSDHIVVTGGAGFIGANCVAMLNALEYERVILVDHLTDNGKWMNLIGLRFSDYLDRDAFLTLVQTDTFPPPAVIVHLGACTNTQEHDERFLIENNAVYTKRLFDYAVRHGVRFMYASSAATYGDGSRGFSDRTHVLIPLNMYGYSKHLADQWTLASTQKPPQWVGLKFFNVYGPREAHKGAMASVAYHGYHQIVRDGVLRLFESYRAEFRDGEQLRDFVYVRDAVDVIRFFLDHPDRSGIYNVGTGRARTFLDLGNALFAALGRPPRIEFIDMPDALRERYQYATEADVSSLRAAGYDHPFTPLEQGIEHYVRSHLASLRS